MQENPKTGNRKPKTGSLILFDFDDTLALTEKYMHAPFYPRMLEILAPYDITMTLEEIAAKNTELYLRHGSSMHGWMHELGLDMSHTLRMFQEMAPTIRAAVMPNLQPDARLIRRLQSLKDAGHTLAILTLGHRNYTLPLLEKLELTQIFPPEMVFDITVMEGRLKRNEATYRHLLTTHLTGEFEQKFMFEDSIANLHAAHNAGFHTILIKERALTPEETTPAIDHHSPDIISGLDYLSTRL